MCCFNTVDGNLLNIRDSTQQETTHNIQATTYSSNDLANTQNTTAVTFARIRNAH